MSLFSGLFSAKLTEFKSEAYGFSVGLSKDDLKAMHLEQSMIKETIPNITEEHPDAVSIVASIPVAMPDNEPPVRANVDIAHGVGVLDQSGQYIVLSAQKLANLFHKDQIFNQNKNVIQFKELKKIGEQIGDDLRGVKAEIKQGSIPSYYKAVIKPKGQS